MKNRKMKNDSKRIKAARISRLFGTDGSVMLTLYRDFPDDFSEDTPLYMDVDGLEVPLYCERFEFRGTTGALVRFEDLDTPRRAGEFTGRELWIHAAEQEQDEFCLDDLIGFAVEAGGLRGSVSDFYDSEANPLFGIEFEGRGEVLVPAVEEFIAGIDFEARRMKMVLPEGLLEL